MGATRALAGKELRQHGGALIGTTLLFGLAWLSAYAFSQSEARTLTPFAILAGFAGYPLAAAALYLGHRLVVVEYFGRTQRFVEALPIPRGRMVAVKAAFGLVCLELWALSILALVAVQASASEPIDRRFLGVLAARLGTYVFALWGVVFLLGFLGRLRFVFGLVLIVGTLAVDRYTRFELSHFGPFALIATETFGLERTFLPVRALAEAAAVGAVGLLGGLALARTKEGSIVESLARPLSPREVSALAILVLAIFTGVYGIARDRPPEAFALTTEKVLRGEGRIEIGYFEDEVEPAARRLMNTLEPSVRTLARDLKLEGALPPLWIVHAPEVPAGKTRSALIHHERGVVLRANLLQSTPTATTNLVAGALHQLLWARTHGRVGHEPRHWILDGVVLHLSLHGAAAAAPPFGRQVDPWLLRALAAAEAVPPTAAALVAYYTTAERLGEELTMAYAASAIQVLEAQVGRARILELARRMLTRVSTRDVRDVLWERAHPMEEVLQKTTGIAWEAFIRTWAAELARARTVAAGALASLPRGRFEVRPGAFRVSVAGTLDVAPAAPLVCTVLHKGLRPYDELIDPDQMSEDAFLWSKGEKTIDRPIDATVTSGARFLVAMECEAPALEVPLRVVARRVTAP